MSTNKDEAITHTVTVRPEQAGQRLDVVLSELLPEISRSRLKNLIQQGCVQSEDIPLLTPASKQAEGAVIDVEMPPVQDLPLVAEDLPLSIVFEDAHLLVVNKPAGLVVHPGAGNWSGTLVNGLLAHCGPDFAGIGGVRRPGIVHRIDKDTSGLLVVAKDQKTHVAFVDMFADHSVHRRYLALAIGVPPKRQGTISTNIGRSPTDRKRMTVLSDDKGKPAITHYNVRKSWQNAVSLLECRLETGRTHQIRVHMAHIGNPLIGDQTYTRWTQERRKKLAGSVSDTVLNFPRQALHAAELGFRHPIRGNEMRFEAPVPDDMQMLLQDLESLSSET